MVKQLTIMGAGNVATVFGRLFKKAGWETVQVYARRGTEAQRLASDLGAGAVSNADRIDQHAGIFLLALPDAALGQVHEWWRCHKGLTVHCSGATPLSDIGKVSERRGVLWPVQSILAHKSTYNPFPVIVQARHRQDENLLYRTAMELTGIAAILPEKDRIALHLAAVMGNNFTNFLLIKLEQYCHGHNLPFDLLLPLLRETMTRLGGHSPSHMQTGPASRMDFNTIERQEALLQKDPATLELYRWFTQQILRWREQSLQG